MAAWLIVTARIPDRDAFMASGYPEAAAKLQAQFGGEYLIRGPGGQVLEGPGEDGASVVVTQWKDREAALAFWNSPEYAEAKKLREGLGEISVTLIGS
ncbi:DUF1330 domain-containing protein [Novosphingobium profundi]|uniref:DUF1330 domain-containing protein n=1 Tax=Novosphingobium profundi TaxID=1774954 RepID=UPI001BD91A93|nr:DUF1330 domain-containing protein [Novosphingobium profundi]MBT0671391.1 DUF1330 domain-containing protein [Novosphingobium profundi]